MLAELQRHLASLYRVDMAHDVRDFLITDPSLARVLSQNALATNVQETLLVAQHDKGLSMSLFLDADMLQRLEAGAPLDSLDIGQLDDFWKVLEGISHFNCMAFKASRERSVSLLELELQAEIDKYLTTVTLALEQANSELRERVHHTLFAATRLREELREDERGRYRAANDYAARFCYRIGQRLAQRGRLPLRELRHFYRLQFNDKISHIHAQVWAAESVPA